MHHCSCYSTEPKNKNIVLHKIQKDEHVHQTILCLILAFVPLHLLQFCTRYDIVQRSIPRPRRRQQQPAMHLMFHQGRVRPRHRQSRGTWRRRCWLRCETRLTAVTCYGARRSRPSTTPSKPTKQRQLGAKRKLRKWRGQWRTRLLS